MYTTWNNLIYFVRSKLKSYVDISKSYLDRLIVFLPLFNKNKQQFLLYLDIIVTPWNFLCGLGVNGIM